MGIKKHNKPRARKIHKLLKAGEYELTSKENAVCDILADIRHYCDKHGIDYAEQNERAARHHRHEREYTD